MDVGGLLFRHRAKVMAGAFVTALLSAVLARGLPQQHMAFWPLWRLVGETAPPPATLLVTGVACLLAFWLRVAGEARLGRAVFGQGATQRLVTDGPFKVNRNPLYTATYLFFVAITCLWAPALAWLAGCAVFAWALNTMVAHEESLLLPQLGADYQRYLDSVGRWLPTLGKRGAKPAQLPAMPWRSVALAALGNIGFASLGAFRVGLALGGNAQVLGAINVGLLSLWLVMLAVRRFQTAKASGPLKG